MGRGMGVLAASMKQRLGRPATRAVAPRKKCDFSSELATCGGGHVHVPGWRATASFIPSGSCAAWLAAASDGRRDGTWAVVWSPTQLHRPPDRTYPRAARTWLREKLRATLRSVRFSAMEK